MIVDIGFHRDKNLYLRNLDYKEYFEDLYDTAKYLIYQNSAITHKDLQRRLKINDIWIDMIRERFSNEFVPKRILRLRKEGN